MKQPRCAPGCPEIEQTQDPPEMLWLLYATSRAVHVASNALFWWPPRRMPPHGVLGLPAVTPAEPAPDIQEVPKTPQSLQ
jgi:hypothetical protein